MTNGGPIAPGGVGLPRPFCGGCHDYLDSAKPQYRELVGRKVKCPKNEEHVGRVINNKPGEWWVQLEQKIRNYDVHYSPLNLFRCGDRRLWQGPYIIFWYVILIALILAVASVEPWPTTCIGIFFRVAIILILLLRIWDVIVVGLSTGYVRQIPAHRLRSVALTLAGFSQVAMAFSVFYLFCRGLFSPPLGGVGATYLSFVVITTLGYAPYSVKVDTAGAWIPQLLIVCNVLAGIVALSIFVPMVVQWAGTPWQPEISLSSNATTQTSPHDKSVSGG